MKSTSRLIWFGLVGLAFIALGASNPQCARTEDGSLNPGLGSLADGNPCVQGCIDAYQTAKKAEQARFKAAMEACNGNGECRTEESLLHESLLMELEATKDACTLNCEHDQGGATGGQ